ncbi:diacylglycerol/lipid kinase family protein [Roseomonas sp. CCTCC AB2023176]|uniref:diacylglycerol/lipid kinase family protein n=1 Tax=Roseomonas sp. CCTCC AB2023176 TaxID=3342640 RepID=UPI0035DE694A
MTRAALVLNERAGTLLSRPELVQLVEEELRAAGFDLLVIRAGDVEGTGISARIEAAIESGAPVVIVGGGDGTIRAVGAQLAGTGRTLGVIPVGTLNLLARDLRLPLEPLEAAQALGRATTRAIDVGMLNGEAFLCQSVIGAPNAIARFREQYRHQRTWRALLRVVFAFVRAMRRKRPYRLTVMAPGWRRPWRLWTRALSVVNNEYDEAPGAMFRRVTLDGGRLTLHVPRRFTMVWSVRMLLRMALGAWKRDADVAILSEPGFVILSRRPHLRVMNDGEVAVLDTPLRYEVRPRALNVLVPRPEDAAA